MGLSGTDLIQQFELYFDGADLTNASLYLCVDDTLGDAGAQRIIAALRHAGLWSAAPAKTVPAEHKPMYAEQMKFIGYRSGHLEGETFHIAAYDHPKFPYHPERWQAWQDCIARLYP
ncbi:MAG: hypothetical protein ACOY42_10455 [Pseudomonadota bacterium]|jgi:hypothetical protein